MPSDIALHIASSQFSRYVWFLRLIASNPNYAKISSAGVAVVGALLGAIVPGVKAVKQDVTEALSYE